MYERIVQVVADLKDKSGLALLRFSMIPMQPSNGQIFRKRWKVVLTCHSEEVPNLRLTQDTEDDMDSDRPEVLVRLDHLPQPIVGTSAMGIPPPITEKRMVTITPRKGLQEDVSKLGEPSSAAV